MPALLMLCLYMNAVAVVEVRLCLLLQRVTISLEQAQE